MKKKKPKPIIYLLVDRANNMGYIGQTTKWLKRRFNRHAIDHTYIGNAIRTHGTKNFDRYVLRECASKGELNFWEQFFIILLGTKAPKGYNLTDGGEGTLGFKLPREKTNYGRPSLFRDDCPYKNLLAEMEAHGITTYRELAELLGKSPSNISDKMRGVFLFSEEDVAKLVEIFGKPAEYLLARDDGQSGMSNFKCSPYKNLFAEMKARGLDYKDLAELLGVTMQTISHKMRGDYDFTNKQKAFLAEFFDKPTEYLFERDDTKISAHDGVKNSAHRRSYKKVYKNLFAEMTAREITVEMLAELLGITSKTLYCKLRGEIKFLDRDKAKLVEIFDKPIDYLLARDNAE